jgi:hypothetical protein
MLLRRLLDDGCEARGQLGGGLVALLLGERGVARQVEKGDRRRSFGLSRRQASLFHRLLGDGDEILDKRMLAMAALEPGEDGGDEVRVIRALSVDDRVALAVRQTPAGDAPAQGAVEELQPGSDEPLDGPAVQPREAGEVVVVGQVELRDDEREELGVLVAHAVVGE